MSDKKLFLLDAYALIYRAYYAFIRAPRINSKGLNTSAVFGFVNTLEELLRKESPTHIAVVFDPKGPTFRHEMYTPYKAHREATPEDIRLAIPIIKDIIKAYNIPVIEVAGYEADDVIGTLSKKGAEAGYEIYMMTPDKDYAQLVQHNVWMYRPSRAGKGVDILGIPEVKEKFGIETPEQVIDILGLMGDAADNIPGCPGVGEKTAMKLIAEYGSIDGIYENIDQLKGKQKEKLVDNKEQVLLSRVLATIKIDVPVEFNEKALMMDEPDKQKLRLLFEELEFRTMAERLLSSPTAAPKQMVQGSLFGDDSQPIFVNNGTIEPEQATFKRLADTTHTYFVVNDEMQRASLRAMLSIQKAFCFDTETTSLVAMEAELVCIVFSWKKGEAWMVPFPENQDDAKTLADEFKGIFADTNITKVAQNIKYDMLVLANYGIDVEGPLFDTMIAHYLLQPDMRHNLDLLAEVYLGYTNIKTEELIGKKGKNQGSMRDVSLEVLRDYACEDADVTWQLKEVLEKAIEKENLQSLFYDIEMPLVKVLFAMESSGVKLDTDGLKNYAIELRQQIDSLEADIVEMAGVTFNVSSPKQVGEVLFETLKIDEKAKRTKSGQFSTAEDVLEKLSSKHPIIAKILEFRGLKKLLNTYVDTLPDLVNARTHRVHTSYNQAVAATGRLSSTNPNMQNIPIRDQAGKEIRRTFVPADSDHIFFSADYSQVELRLMAHLSEDENMISAFTEGEDIHAATAAKIYGIPLEEVTTDMRRKAKTANFGIIYGISAFGLADRLSISRSEAKQLIDGYFATYPKVKEYMQTSIDVARDNGYVSTIFNRKRTLPDINSKNGVVRGMAERNAINAPIQGSAADIIKVAMIKIQQRIESEGLKSKMILQVHDELNFDVLKSEAEIIKTIVVEEMEGAIDLKVPLIVDCGAGENWLEAH